MAQITTTRKYGVAIGEQVCGLGSDTFDMNTVTMKPYTAGPTPTPDSVPGDFTEASFSGYSPTPTTPTGPINQPDGSATVNYEKTFICDNDTTTPNTIIGVMLIPASPFGAMIGACQFDSPVQIIRKNDGFTLDVNMNFGSEVSNNFVEVE